MKIAYVTHAHANMGGMDKILSVKANWLIDKGHDVSIVSNSSKETEPFFHFDPKIKIYYMNTPQKKKRKEYITELESIINQIQPDIAISTGMRNARFLYQVCHPCKKILESHFSKYQKRYKLAYFDQFTWGHYITNFFVKLKDSIVKKYDKLVLLTYEDKKSYSYLQNVKVIPNPLFSYPPHVSTCENKSAIAVGRLASQKGYDYMIDIWKEVVKTHPDWILNIYGEGKKEKQLKKQIKNGHLENTIVIHPFSKNVYELYANNSIFLFTSRYEGLPLVYMEAMASGLPSISFDCKCGPSDLITDRENGFLIPFGNKKKFEEKVSYLMDNKEERLRMGQNGVSEMTKYQLDLIMQKWENLFHQLTDQ